jgi:hypothetical protein
LWKYEFAANSIINKISVLLLLLLLLLLCNAANISVLTFENNGDAIVVVVSTKEKKQTSWPESASELYRPSDYDPII